MLKSQPDVDVFIVHCTGGFRGSKFSDNQWRVAPILEGGEVRVKGFLSSIKMESLFFNFRFKVLGFQSSGWWNGQWFSSWRPIIPNEQNHFWGPSDIWSSISGNIFSATRAQQLREMKDASHSKIASILDEKTFEERIAKAISLSLRSMDLAVEKISEHYNGQLINIMRRGQVEGQRISNTLDQNLFAHVHAFFLQIGSARDYLAAFISNRLGMNANHGKVDTMNALRGSLRLHHAGREPILDILINNKYLIPQDESGNRWVISGWLKEVTDLRNEFVHRRPYGSVYSEQFGWVSAVNAELGLYRYFRPIEIGGKLERDLLDVICYHYRMCTGLFFEAAKASGLDGAMMTLTDKDIVSQKLVSSLSTDQ